MNVWKYECMYVCSKWKGVPYHLWAKMLHPEDPPPHLLEAPKTCGGGYISCGQVKYFSDFFCLTPPNIPGLKGGDVITVMKRRDPSPGTCRKNNPLPPNVGFILFSSVLFFLFSSLALTTSAFHLSILSEVWLLNFLRQYFQFHFLSVKVILIRPYVTQINVILINIF